MVTTFALETCPRPDLLIEYAFAQSLISMSILENFNTFSMGDGQASLTINRAAMLQSVGSDAMRRYRESLILWKRTLRPGLLGLGTGFFPFMIRRAIGFLPNMKHVFG
jgi:hypothetical protein